MMSPTSSPDRCRARGAPGCAGKERTACDGSASHPRRSEHPRISQTRAAPEGTEEAAPANSGRSGFDVGAGVRGGIPGAPRGKAEEGGNTMMTTTTPMLIYRGKLVSGPAALPRLMLRELTSETAHAGTS